jgi:hypothetical protein
LDFIRAGWGRTRFTDHSKKLATAIRQNPMAIPDSSGMKRAIIEAVLTANKLKNRMIFVLLNNIVIKIIKNLVY